MNVLHVTKSIEAYISYGGMPPVVRRRDQAGSGSARARALSKLLGPSVWMVMTSALRDVIVPCHSSSIGARL
jgi:hypothetical protein